MSSNISTGLTLSASNGTDTFMIVCGIGNTTGPGQPTNGMYFRMDANTNANFRCITRKASAETDTDSTIALDTGFHDLMLVVNAAGTAVDFYIDGVVVAAAVATNIPLTTTAMNTFFGIIKSAGTTARVTNFAGQSLEFVP